MLPMLHMLPIRFDNVEDFLTYTKSLLSVLCTMLTCYCPCLTCIICLKYLIKQKEVIKECVNICQMVAQFGTRWLKTLICGFATKRLTFTSDFLTAPSRFSLGICSSWLRVWPTSVLEFSKEPGNTGCGNGNPRKCLSLPSCPLGCYTLLVTLSGKGRMIRRWWRWSGGTKKFRCIHSPIHSRTCAIWDSPLMKTRSSSRTLPSAQVCVNMSFSVI